jgi:membrane-bound serine protease (ClpP class)
VYVIPVNGDVEPAMAAYIERAVLEVGTDTGAIIVLELDTFGGRVDSALKIVDTMTADQFYPGRPGYVRRKIPVTAAGKVPNPGQA